MSILAGTVTSVTGMVQAQNPTTGEMRVLKVGDEVQVGDVIVTSINGNISITLQSGELLTLGRDSQIALDESVLGAEAMADTAAEEPAVDVEALQRAVLEGDIEGLDETAAGPGAGEAGADGSANAGALNTVERIGAEGEVTSGYDTSTAGLAAAAPGGPGGNVAPDVEPEVAIVYEDTIVEGQIDFIDENPETVTVEFVDGVEIPEGFTLNPDGSYTLDANSYDYLAVDQTEQYVLPIVLTDGDGAQTESTLTVTVIGTNDIPILVAEQTGAVVEADTPTLTDSGELSFSDLDLIDTHTMSASFNNDAVWSGGDLTPAQIDAITSGFTADLDSWDYSVPSGEVQFLAEGETIQFSYDVTVDDSHGGTDTAQVVMTITGTNDIPDITAEVSTGFVKEIVDNAEGENTSVLSDSMAIEFTDVDINDSHVVSVTAQGPEYLGGLTASITDASTGDGTGEITWTFEINDADVDYLAAGQTLEQAYDITVEDEHGATDVHTVTITIEGTNDAPILTADTSGSVTEDDIFGEDNGEDNGEDYFPGEDNGEDFVFRGPLVGEGEGIGEGEGEGEGEAYFLTDSGELSFTDVDLIDTHTMSASYNNDAVWSGGTLTPTQIAALTSDFTVDMDSWDYSVNNNDVQFLGAGETVTFSYDVTVADNNGGTDTATVVMTINGTNDIPDITSEVSSGFVKEIVDNAPNELIETLTATMAIDFTDLDLTDSHIVSVASLGKEYLGTLSASISDVSTGDGAGQITWLFEVPDADLDYLGAGQTLTQDYRITVHDGHGGMDTHTVTITIEGTNDAPILTADTSGGVTEDYFPGEDNGEDVVRREPLVGEGEGEGGPGAYFLTDSGDLSFTDVDLIDTHTMYCSYNNDAVWSGGTLTPTQISALTSDFTVDLDSWDYSVDNSDVQFLGAGETVTFSYNVTVDDHKGGTDTETVVMTIRGTNDVPTIDGEQARVVEAGHEDDGTVVTGVAVATGFMSADDADANAQLTFSGGEDSPYGKFEIIDTTTGEWKYTLDNQAADTLAEGETETETFTVRVTDEQGAWDEAQVEITIHGTNDRPIATNAAFETDSNVLEFNLAKNTSDIEDDRDGEVGDGSPGQGDDWVTRVEIVTTPEHGSLYDGTVKLGVGDIVDDPTTIRYEVDPVELGFNATTDVYHQQDFSEGSSPTYTTDSGFTIAGFKGDAFGDNSSATPQNLWYDSAWHEEGLGLGPWYEQEITANRGGEYMSVLLPTEATSATILLGSIWSHYQDSSSNWRPDAQINIVALNDGEVVTHESFNDMHNYSGLFQAPLMVEDGFDEVRIFIESNKCWDSNIVLQGIEIDNIDIEDSFQYQALDVEDAVSEVATVTLLASTDEPAIDNILIGEDQVNDSFDIDNAGETTLIQGFEPGDEIDISDVVDSTVRPGNIDQYVKLGYVDEDGDGDADSTIMTIDQNGDRPGGDVTTVIIDGVVDDEWKIDADNDTKGDFDLDD